MIHTEIVSTTDKTQTFALDDGGSRSVRIQHDLETGGALAVAYVNYGETACMSKTFKRGRSAIVWALRWIEEA